MGRPPIGKKAMSGAERTRRYREKFRHDAPVTKPTHPDAALAKRLAQAEAELARAKVRIAEFEARGEQPPDAPPDAATAAEIAALRDENNKFRAELGTWNHVIKTRNGGGLTSGQYRILQQCCHPDNSASPETRAKGIRLINQLRYVLCNEAELPTMDRQKFHISFQKLWAQRQATIKEAKKRAKRRRTPARAAKTNPPKSLG
jgi:hypothetical protein